MHLTGGQFKGRHLATSIGENSPVKPTLSKVRESVFNMLFSEFGAFENLSFLDMFTGSGIMALEAYSRGFKSVFAIELNQKVFLEAQKNFKNFGAEISLRKGDCLKIINKLPEFDIIYLDPPWQFDYAQIVESALSKTTENGVVIVEYDKLKTIKRAKSPYLFCGKEILPFKEKNYGRCYIDFLRKTDLAP